MKSFNLLIKKSMWAVLLSVALVVLPTTTVQALTVAIAHIDALLSVEVTNGALVGFQCCEEGSGFPPDGSFNVDPEFGSALALSTTQFPPLGGGLPTPFQPVGVTGVQVSASVFAAAVPDPFGLGVAIAGSKGTFKLTAAGQDAELKFTLDPNFLIAGGSIVDEGPGTFEAAIAAVALGVFVNDDLRFPRFTFDVAKGDDGFIRSGGRTRTFERTLRAGRSITAGVGVLAAGAAISKQKNDAIPEPTTILLLGTGLVGIGLWRMRKDRSKIS